MELKKGEDSAGTINGLPFSGMPLTLIGLSAILVAALMVYSFLLFFIPYARYTHKRRFIWTGIMVNIGFWMMALLAMAIIVGVTVGPGKNLDKETFAVVALLATFFSGVITGAFFALYYFIDLYDQQQRLSFYRSALTEKIEAETAFLRNQVNPHFLFNTLNNIYSLLLNSSPQGVAVAKELRYMMQYVLEDCAHEKVPLAGEIRFLKNYVSLEQLRNHKEQVKVQFLVTGDAAGQEIAPLLLINFLENAFKHGVKAGLDESYVNVHIEISGSKLKLQMENSKPPAQDTADDSIREDGGIGIANVKRRLDILYPKQYRLDIQDNPNEYLVLLTIAL